jgi:hypothetical protein
VAGLKNNMPQNFTLYAIYSLGGAWEDEPFDETRLPFDVAEGVRIEDVRPLFREDTFAYTTQQMGNWAVDHLRRCHYALVHRYDPESILVDGEIVGEQDHNDVSDLLVRSIAACLRLIRPMRVISEVMRGRVRDDQTFDLTGFDHPANIVETPENEKLFHVRDRDADDLRTYAPEFLRAMRGQFWKFRMGLQFFQLGHFQDHDWKARYLLWASAIESIYTSHNWEHKGGLVAKERIKWFLGENTSIYPAGELNRFVVDPHITVGDIVDRLYEVRNFLAHGDRVPEAFFQDILRRGMQGGINALGVLAEAQSFIIRISLLRILRDGLLNHFADAAPSEAYFGAQGLTRRALQARQPRPEQVPAQLSGI